MPRGKPRTTQTGERALKVQSVTGRRYGEGPESTALQEAMPAPNRNQPIEAATPQVPVGKPVYPSMPVDPSMVTQYLGSQNPNLLSGSKRPDEPVTSGMATGPGRGPQGPRVNTQLARTLQQLAEETGNSKWTTLAQKAGLWR